MKLIVDGNNLAYRCDYALDLYTSTGKRTSVISGGLNSLNNLILNLQEMLDENVTDMIVVWDSGKAERRLKLLPEYKGQRHKETDEESVLRRQELKEQMNYFCRILPYFGVKSLKINNQEADDLAYVLKCEYRKRGIDEDLVFITTDEDYLQLVDENTMVWSPIKELLITKENFEKLIEVPLEYFIQYKALAGDKSDNIPGIKGIGKKTAKSLITKYKTIENVLEDTENLEKSKRLQPLLLDESKEQLSINLQMIDFSYVEYSDISKEINDFIDAESVINIKEVMKVLKENQLVDIFSKLESFLRVFKSIENTKII